MLDEWQDVTPVPCAHIAAYYAFRWGYWHNLFNKLLWQGYAEQAAGRIQRGFNNLYE